MKKKILLTITLLLTFFIGIGIVNAEDEKKYEIKTVDPSTYTIRAAASNLGQVGSELKITLRDSRTYDEVISNSYYVYFLKNQDDPKPNLETYKGKSKGLEYLFDFPTSNDTSGIHMVFANGSVFTSNEWYILNGYDWVYIIRSQTKKGSSKYVYEITETPINIAKPNLPELNQRYNIYLFNKDKKISIYNNYPYSETSGKTKIGNHTLETKIGIIKDTDLLKRFAQGEKPYQDLLTYAKNNDGFKYTFVDDQNVEQPLDNMKVVNGSYYFIYTRYVDTTTYRDIEGINLAKGENDSLVSSFNFNEMETVKSLQTDYTMVILIILIIILIAVGVIIFIIIKKKNGGNRNNGSFGGYKNYSNYSGSSSSSSSSYSSSSGDAVHPYWKK